MAVRVDPRAGAVALALLAALLARASVASEASAVRALEECERHHAELEALSARFVQIYRSAATGVELEESGRLHLKRPGRLRFDYRQPRRKFFVVDPSGLTLAWDPADRAAVRSRLPEGAPHLDLLRGESDLVRDFAVSDVTLREPSDPASRQLKLVPRRPMPGVGTAYLELSPDSRRIHRVLVVDPLGNETDLILSRWKENPRLTDAAFDLTLPAGVEVQDLTEGGR